MYGYHEALMPPVTFGQEKYDTDKYICASPSVFCCTCMHMLQVKIKSLKYMVIVAMEWKDHLVRSDEFDNPSGHQNPNSMPVESYTIKADPVKVGAFILSKGKLQYHM